MAETTTSSARTHRAAKRYIYAWGDGRAEGDGSMKDLLGGKGAGLAEMTNAGLPTPPGFTITTAACNDYFESGRTLPVGLWEDVLEAVKEIEARVGTLKQRHAELQKELDFFQGKKKPPAKLEEELKSSEIDLKAQESLLAAKQKEVDAINAKYDDDKKRYIELTRGSSK